MEQLTFFFTFDAETLVWVRRADASIRTAQHQIVVLKSFK